VPDRRLQCFTAVAREGGFSRAGAIVAAATAEGWI
jgi:DNA-binding transcriptional LysR family regulator